MKFLAGVYLFPVVLTESQSVVFSDIITRLQARGTVVPALRLGNNAKHLKIEIFPEKNPTNSQTLYDTHYKIRAYDSYSFCEKLSQLIGHKTLKHIAECFVDAPEIVVTLVKHRSVFYAKASVYLNTFDNCKSTDTIRKFDKNHITTIYCSRLLDTDLSHELEAENYPLGLTVAELGSMTTEQLNAYARLRNVMCSLSKRLDHREQEIAISLLRYLVSTGMNILSEIDGRLLGYKTKLISFTQLS